MKGRVKLELQGKTPAYLAVYNDLGDCVYFKEKPTRIIDINLPKSKDFKFSSPVDILEVSDKPKNTFPVDFDLPEPEHYFPIENLELKTNNDLTTTPARIFPALGIIEVMPDFWKLPQAYRVAIIMHEIGHHFYENEVYADLFALKSFLKQGGNISEFMSCLKNVLTKNDLMIQRVLVIFHILNEQHHAMA